LITQQLERKQNRWLSVLRTLGYFILAVFLLANAAIVLSGRYYIYTGIRHTYLQGKTGPSIYDLDVFPTATISNGTKSTRWIQASQSLTRDEMKGLRELDTKAFLVLLGDSILNESYFDEHRQETLSNSFSMAKTVVAFLIGISIEEGKIKSLDEPVGNYLPAFKEKGRDRITIRHLLQMSSGLDWEESGVNPFSENAESYYGTDLYGLVTRQLPIEQPGKRFNYLSGNTQLLGFILQKATGLSVPELTQEKLWKHIGAEKDAQWSLESEKGNAKAFCCLYATTRDYARLGKLLINEGQWNGKQLIPKWFIAEMTEQNKLATNDDILNLRYGLHIWTYRAESHPIYYFQGLKGQFIIVSPRENLVVVRLGEKRTKEIKPEDVSKGQEKRKGLARIGHSPDVMYYLSVGRNVKNRSKR
jgi:CubicO group peptidase (beta-lactamase class C family)